MLHHTVRWVTKRPEEIAVLNGDQLESTMAPVLERRPDAKVDFTLSMAAVLRPVMTTEHLLALLRASAKEKEFA